MSRIYHDIRCVGFFQGLALLLIGAATLQFCLWIVDRSPPVTVISSKPTSFAMAGAQLNIEYEVERHRSCAVHLDRSIIDADSRRIPLADEDWAAAPGPMGRDSFRESVIVPTGTTAGPATYRVIAAYRCNPLQAAWLAPIIVRSEVRFVVAQ